MELEKNNNSAIAIAKIAEEELARIQELVDSSVELSKALSDVDTFVQNVANNPKLQEALARNALTQLSEIREELERLGGAAVKYSDNIRLGRDTGFIRCRDHSSGSEKDCVWGGKGDESWYEVTRK